MAIRLKCKTICRCWRVNEASRGTGKADMQDGHVRCAASRHTAGTHGQWVGIDGGCWRLECPEWRRTWPPRGCEHPSGVWIPGDRKRAVRPFKRQSPYQARKRATRRPPQFNRDARWITNPTPGPQPPMPFLPHACGAFPPHAPRAWPRGLRNRAAVREASRRYRPRTRPCRHP